MKGQIRTSRRSWSSTVGAIDIELGAQRAGQLVDDRYCDNRSPHSRLLTYQERPIAVGSRAASLAGLPLRCRFMLSATPGQRRSVADALRVCGERKTKATRAGALECK